MEHSIKVLIFRIADRETVAADITGKIANPFIIYSDAPADPLGVEWKIFIAPVSSRLTIGLQQVEAAFIEDGEISLHDILLFSCFADLAGAASWNKSPSP
jgi:hypothetical protein